MSREQSINEIMLSFINFRKGLVKHDSEHDKILPKAQSEALYSVFHHKEVAVSELARLLSVTPGAATQLSDALVQLGYLERTIDANDRRVTKLRLSASGTKTLKELKKAKIAKLNQVLEPLNNMEVETLARLLNKVSQSIHNQGGK